MILFLTGVPGSGKTYKAVDYIYNNFSDFKGAIKDKKNDYKNCYTNINELKTDLLQNVKKLDFDDLKTKLIELHTIYKDKNKNDNDLIEKCKEFDLYKSLFIIDECHNFFDTNDKVLIWWFSYHRHLFHNIYLITQNLSLVYTKYKSFSEFFYKAKPSSVSIFDKTFKYDVFIGSRMSLKDKSHIEKLPKNKEVFEIYQSGDKVGSTNVVRKFLYLSLVALVFLIAIFYYITSSMSPAPTKTEDNNSTNIQTTINQTIINEDKKITAENKKFYSFKCRDNLCSYDNNIIPISIINSLNRYFDEVDIVATDYKTKFYTLHIIANRDIDEFLNLTQGFKDEKVPTSNLDNISVF